ncbi:MAG: PD-(D/E)XK nuclease family transposase, partial [Fibrobacter sp.]|nr:PD-(D/E)XK nuclease family transposase [Fibrobacter sp.]
MSENSGIVPVSLADRDLYREQWVDKTVEEIKKHKYLNPLFDAAFKAFLSDEQALKSFLNGIFKDDCNKIESVIIKNPEINIIFPVVKPFRLDIRAKTSNGFSINVEMQKARPD